MLNPFILPPFLSIFIVAGLVGGYLLLLSWSLLRRKQATTSSLVRLGAVAFVMIVVPLLLVLAFGGWLRHGTISSAAALPLALLMYLPPIGFVVSWIWLIRTWLRSRNG